MRRIFPRKSLDGCEWIVSNASAARKPGGRNLERNKMKESDCQQLVPGMATVEVIGGPMVVRVHRALDKCIPKRYGHFISVDLRFRRSDALNIGNPGYDGMTKGESVKAAKELARKIAFECELLNLAEKHNKENDCLTTRITLRIRKDSLYKVVGRYNSEFIL